MYTVQNQHAKYQNDFNSEIQSLQNVDWQGNAYSCGRKMHTSFNQKWYVSLMFVFLQAARSNIFIPYAQAHSSGSRLRAITGCEKLKYVLKRLDITQLSSPLHVSTAPFTFPSRLIAQRGDKSRWTTMSSSRKTTLLRFGKSWFKKREGVRLKKMYKIHITNFKNFATEYVSIS